MKCMKNAIVVILGILMSGYFSSALAETREIDLNRMTVNELDALIDEIKAEKKEAIEFNNDTYRLLVEDFERIVISIMPECKEISYPLLGLSKERERECYQVWGDCKIKFEDNSELKLKNAHAVYWYDATEKIYRHVAFFTDETIYYCDGAVLPHVERYLDQAIVKRLQGGNFKLNLTDVEEVKSSESIEMIKNGKIIMPYESNEYCGNAWSLDQLTKHFSDLGFTNIVTYAVEPEDDDYQKSIYEVYIETGLFGGTETWEANEDFKADSEISIYYNKSPILRADNCDDLLTVLTSKNMTYKSFASKYDGCYVEFNAYVTNHTTYDGGTSHIIDVTGGDYDGKRKLDSYDESCYDGLVIRIGDRTWNNFINENVEPGDHVFVSGRIDASWSEYYKQLYVETMQLYGR